MHTSGRDIQLRERVVSLEERVEFLESLVQQLVKRAVLSVVDNSAMPREVAFPNKHPDAGRR